MRSLWDMILRKKVYPLIKNIAVENSKVSNRCGKWQKNMAGSFC
jgi:hypothetical protein